MKLPDQTMQVGAFVDGELDLADRLEMEEGMRADEGLRRQVAETRQLREAVREGADYHPAPAALRARWMAAPVQPPEPPGEGRQALRQAPHRAYGGSLGEAIRRGFGWGSLAASLSAAAVLAVTINLAWLHSSKEAQLMDEVVASHVRSMLGQHLVDVSSADHHTVKPFLSSRLGFSPPVDRLAEPGSEFLGGRIDYLDDRPVAALVYRQGQHVVNSFVWPAAAADSKPTFAEARGYRTAHWVEHGMIHWVISDVNRDEFQAVVRAVQTAGADQ